MYVCICMYVCMYISGDKKNALQIIFYWYYKSSSPPGLTVLLVTCLESSVLLLYLSNNESLKLVVTCKEQCWVSYSKNVIYDSSLVTPFKSNIVTYYFLATLISYTASYITFSSRLT